MKNKKIKKKIKIFINIIIFIRKHFYKNNKKINKWKYFFDEIERESYEEINSIYQFENLSPGSFGSVIKAINRNTKEEVSIKIINKLHSNINTSKLKNEILILKDLSHPNIIKI